MDKTYDLHKTERFTDPWAKNHSTVIATNMSLAEAMDKLVYLNMTADMSTTYTLTESQT